MKNRAKIEILSELLSFPTIRNKDWHPGAEVGDLVSMSCARPSRWYLSWLVEIGAEPNGDRKYLLESIETGELCWWSNVGIRWHYSRERIAEMVTWKWDDGQFRIWDEWRRIADRSPHRACLPRFIGPCVRLSVRRVFFNTPISEKVFPNWRALKVSEFRRLATAFFEECSG